MQYNDNRNTSDKQNTKFDNISDTSNDLLSKHYRAHIFVKSGSTYVKPSPKWSTLTVECILPAKIRRFCDICVCHIHCTSHSVERRKKFAFYREIIPYGEVLLRSKGQILRSLGTNCAYFRRKWIDLHQSNAKKINGPFYTYRQIGLHFSSGEREYFIWSNSTSTFVCFWKSFFCE